MGKDQIIDAKKNRYHEEDVNSTQSQLETKEIFVGIRKFVCLISHLHSQTVQLGIFPSSKSFRDGKTLTRISTTTMA